MAPATTAHETDRRVEQNRRMENDSRKSAVRGERHPPTAHGFIGTGCDRAEPVARPLDGNPA
jgi:hypothetical protein